MVCSKVRTALKFQVGFHDAIGDLQEFVSSGYHVDMPGLTLGAFPVHNWYKPKKLVVSQSLLSFSLGTRWRESRTICPAFLSKCIVIARRKRSKQSGNSGSVFSKDEVQLNEKYK